MGTQESQNLTETKLTQSPKAKGHSRLLAIVVIILALFFLVRNNFMTHHESRIVATVNDEQIRLGEFQLHSQQYGQQLDAATKNRVLDDLIAKKVITIFADKNGYMNDSTFVKQFQYMKDEIYTQVLLEEFITSHKNDEIAISDEELDAYLVQHPYMNVRLLFIPFETDSAAAFDAIAAAYNEIQEKNNFSAVRKKYMKKEFLGNTNKPELVLVNDLERMFDHSPLPLEVGTVSEPLKNAAGYFLLQRTDDPSKKQMLAKANDSVLAAKEEQFIVGFIDEFKAKLRIYSENVALLLAGTAQSESPAITAENMTMTCGDIREYFDRFGASEQLLQIKESELKNVVSQLGLQQLMRAQAVEEDIQNSRSFLLQWEAKSKEFDNTWTDFVTNQVYQTIVQPIIMPTSTDISDYYEQHQSEFTQDDNLLPLAKVQYSIYLKLSTEKREHWMKTIIEKYNIEIKKNEKYL